jgi:hypothetical protein
MASYFIRIDTYWQNSPDRFVGPFKNRKDAEAAIKVAQDADTSLVVRPGQSARDIKRGIRVLGVVPATVARRNYGMTERNTLSRVIPINTEDLREHEEAYLPY